jgi:ferredoxin
MSAPKILSVDDSRMIHTLINKGFAPYDVQMVFASNGAEGLEAAAREMPDVILLDVTMPVMDGVECLSKLKADPTLKDIGKARMGLAVVDAESCLSWQGLRCEVCYRVCPVKGDAISIQNHPRRTSKHALFVPIVHSEACTGCGMCEDACPTEVAAIRSVNPKLVQGRIGSHYRLGWKSETPITQEFVPMEAPAAAPPPAAVEQPAPKTAPGMDFLNEGLEP